MTSINDNKNLSVSIVVYASAAISQTHSKWIILRELIHYLQSDRLVSQVILIDNSPYQFFRLLSEAGGKVRYIWCEGKNLGFGKGHNKARHYVNTRYHLILNPDIAFDDNKCLSRLVTEMEKDNTIGIIQPLILSWNSTSAVQYLCKRNPTLLIQLYRGFFSWIPSKHLKIRNDYYEMRDKAYMTEPVESQYLSGCFLLCRTSLLNSIGWFDEDFFMYLEDADICRRASILSRCVHYPIVSVRHVWERGSHKKLRLRIIAIYSYLLYSRKWGLDII